MNMSPILTLLATLTLLLSVSLAVTPAEVPPNGKAHGFISNLNNLYPQPDGDWLTSTSCFCRAPATQEKSGYDKAHIFQHEYYNYHSNATFVVDHLCLGVTHFEGDNCNRPNVGGDNNDWLMHQRDVCKKFPRTEEEKVRQGNSKRSTWTKRLHVPHMPDPPICEVDCDPGPYREDPEDQSSHPDHDKICFAVDASFYGMDTMEVQFNRQRRRMKKIGDQGGVKTRFDEVQGYCADMCQSKFNMAPDMKVADKRAAGGSRQVVYTKLDDMCDHCK